MYQYLIFVHARETKRIIWTRSTTRAFKISFPKSYHTTLGAYQKVRLDTIFVTHTRNPQIPTGLLPSTTFDLFDFCKTLKLLSAIRHQRQLPPEQTFAKPESFVANSACGNRNRKTERKKEKTKTKTESFILYIL